MLSVLFDLRILITLVVSVNSSKYRNRIGGVMFSAWFYHTHVLDCSIRCYDFIIECDVGYYGFIIECDVGYYDFIKECDFVYKCFFI